MANTYTNGVIFVDTVDASDLLTEQFTVSKIRWVGATASGHQVIVRDSTGVRFWESVANGANYVESEDFSGRNPSKRTMSGLEVPTLDSGNLYIYTE